MSKTVQEKDTLKNLSNASNVEMPANTESISCSDVKECPAYVKEGYYITDGIIERRTNGQEYKSRIEVMDDSYIIRILYPKKTVADLAKGNALLPIRVYKQGISVESKYHGVWQLYKAPIQKEDRITLYITRDTDKYNSLYKITYYPNPSTSKAKAKKANSDLSKAEVKEEAKIAETNTDAKALKAYRKGRRVNCAHIGEGVITRPIDTDDKGVKHVTILFDGADKERYFVLDPKKITLIKKSK